MCRPLVGPGDVSKGQQMSWRVSKGQVRSCKFLDGHGMLDGHNMSVVGSLGHYQ